LGANSLLSCIFSGLIVAPALQTLLQSSKKPAADLPASLYSTAVADHQRRHDDLLKRPTGGENPYLLHQQLGDIMTRAATVVRRNTQLTEAFTTVCELAERAARCSLSDHGNWTNQNVVFTKALLDMFPIAKTILLGAIKRDECRGAHFKPDFARQGISATDPAERRRQAEDWCDQFEENNRRFLKSTISNWKNGEVHLTYEDVDTSLIPPRPRLYGLVGAEMIEEVWRERAKKKIESADGNGSATHRESAVAVH
jgi:succinate dehydrogenase / fumarate reductase flavoprotein subunit